METENYGRNKFYDTGPRVCCIQARDGHFFNKAQSYKIFLV
jgi:hypothetical protein